MVYEEKWMQDIENKLKDLNEDLKDKELCKKKIEYAKKAEINFQKLIGDFITIPPKQRIIFQKVCSAFANNNRMAIMKLCQTPYNISQISEKLEMNYNVTFANVKFLEEIDLVEIDEQKSKKNKPSIVKTTNKAVTIHNAIMCLINKEPKE